MRRIYMDNSATSFPKPPGVAEAMARFAAECGASAGRGAYDEAKACGEMIAESRRLVAELIGAESPDRIVFTLNCSEALAIGIRGLLNTARDAHAVTTVMDHNSVLRPLTALAEQTGLDATWVRADPITSLVRPDDLRDAIRPNTRLVAVAHCSNVTGSLQPVAEIAAIARQANVPCLIDAAQSVGHVPIDVQAWGADMVAFPGHKGALGPLGTGVLYVRPGFEDQLATMKEGGTGTVSEEPRQPQTMPDKLEIGSHNAIGIAGLAAGVRWLLGRGIDHLRRHDMELCGAFLAAARADGLTVYGPTHLAARCGVFSVSIAGLKPYELAGVLETRYGILTRPGLHCAPLAHKAIGTFPAGTCRLSFGAFTTADDVRFAAAALAEIAAAVRAGTGRAGEG
ncbi:MAG TPA: aminotransferase class V-fold PLP-dependent enzyme [Phycisphaerae bacterium]|nr:aminotransferase class V-fold PLP-dependent enzyme [Phycisphaerae bacterium]